MAYFPNGTSGMIYLDDWCSRCVHWKYDQETQTAGCPIWDLHMLYNYEKDSRLFLDFLIPMTKDKLFADKCKMFIEQEGEIKGQLHFEF